MRQCHSASEIVLQRGMHPFAVAELFRRRKATADGDGDRGIKYVVPVFMESGARTQYTVY